MDPYTLTDAEERRIIEGGMRAMFDYLKEKEPGAIGFEPWDIPAFEFKRTPRNYTHLKIDGKRVLTCEDYTLDGGAYNIDGIVRVVARTLADARLISFYQFRNRYGVDAQ